MGRHIPICSIHLYASGRVKEKFAHMAGWAWNKKGKRSMPPIFKTGALKANFVDETLLVKSLIFKIQKLERCLQGPFNWNENPTFHWSLISLRSNLNSRMEPLERTDTYRPILSSIL